VTRDEVLAALEAFLRVEYGRLVVLRELRRDRRAAGIVWTANVVVPAKEGDLPLRALEIDDEDGTVRNPIDVDDFLALVRAPRVAEQEPIADDPFAADLGDLLDLGEPTPAPAAVDLEGEALYLYAAKLAGGTSAADLERARSLMPRLLDLPDRRGAVLVWMAVIERKLGNPEPALRHLDAAAREFADRFDVGALEKLAALARELTPDDAWARSNAKRLLDDAREKLRPVESPFETPQFAGLPEGERAWLSANLASKDLAEGDVLVREGEPSRAVFVIESGLIGVHLERPEGGTRLVRCCYPGWVLGESSVLIDDDPRCTATLRAERASRVWSVDAAILKDAMRTNPGLRYRIESTKHLHRIDSFFSMHELTRGLEAAVRDELLACIRRIEQADDGAVLLAGGEVPERAYLVLRGEIALHDAVSGNELGRAGADRFVGFRDAIHAIASGVRAVARDGALVAVFDGEPLRALAQKSAEDVVAVLERLG
jgi:CRP-like cAMP-binding protein